MNTPPITLINNWISQTLSRELFTHLLTTISWREETIKIFGKSIIVPRKIAWYGDAKAMYRYSGITHEPLPWITALHILQQRIDVECSVKFNSVLCNLYKDGKDYMGWHRDKEPELGTDPIIASVSLGAPRRFIFRHTHSGVKHEVMLNSGSLLLMHEGCQQYWQHSLPKMITVMEPRINLTFRYVQH
jgi:alkylated DNA repair dioxygenase AlkB